MIGWHDQQWYIPEGRVVLTWRILFKILYVKPCNNDRKKRLRTTAQATYICWGSSSSYSPFCLRDAYIPFCDRKSGIPQDTPAHNYDEYKPSTVEIVRPNWCQLRWGWLCVETAGWGIRHPRLYYNLAVSHAVEVYGVRLYQWLAITRTVTGHSMSETHSRDNATLRK